MLQKGAQTVQPGIPELFVPIQPRERALERAPLEPATDHAADLATFDESRFFEDAEMLDEAGQRHRKGIGQCADRAFSVAQPRQHRTPRGIGERGKDGVQMRLSILNHLVHFNARALGCQGCVWVWPEAMR